ncbi:MULTISPECIES: TetR/AcrR family transcriptional regulator [Streptomyces]|uniref:TetR/AcrR family transcriptional regulator n=1 Tax=Streptomyces TaxID=1883 RepID=UPI0019652F23|nr:MULTISPECIES: TetR family transcriptional regulator [Streptomyces]QRX96243.1 TetR family transcriptional regulator [Streptomyces noursei]UJB45003.1 TetR/AcrR family transcriptional regulator [Streptomyces sp. A1-5]
MGRITPPARDNVHVPTAKNAKDTKGPAITKGAKSAQGARSAGRATSPKGEGKAEPTPAPASPDRRRELLDTAAEVFAAQGYNATTVRQIADAAGMLAGSLYYHFDSKESMVDEILAAFLDELWAGYDAVLEAGLGPRETIEALVTESFREIDRHRAAVAIYQKEARYLATQPRFGYLTESRRKFERAWLGTLERGVAEGVFRADLDLRLAYRFLRDTVWVAASWYRPEGRHSPEEIARQYLAMVLDGIALPS